MNDDNQRIGWYEGMNVPDRPLQLTDDEQASLRERLLPLIRQLKEEKKQRELKKIQEEQQLPEELFTL